MKDSNVEALGKLLDEAGMQVTLTGWRHELEDLEKKVDLFEERLKDYLLPGHPVFTAFFTILRDAKTLDEKLGKKRKNAKRNIMASR
jgi:hypothetical protein